MAEGCEILAHATDKDYAQCSFTVRAAREAEVGVSSESEEGPEEDGGLPRPHGCGESRDSGATDPSESGTSEARAT